MGEVRSTLIKLEPTDNAMIGEILGDARFRYAQMFRELGFEGIRATAARTPAQEISDRDAQGLARFDVVVASEVGIGEDEHAGANWGVVRFAKFYRRAGQQAAELHLEKRQSGRQAGIARTPANGRATRFANRFDRR